jgi:thiol:disulfide interchange protein
MFMFAVGFGFVVLAAATCWLVWVNRDSEAVKSQGFGALAVAVVALLATLFFTLKAPEAQRRRFPVVFVVERSTLLPVAVPGLARVSPGISGQAFHSPQDPSRFVARFGSGDHAALDRRGQTAWICSQDT